MHFDHIMSVSSICNTDKRMLITELLWFFFFKCGAKFVEFFFSLREGNYALSLN